VLKKKTSKIPFYEKVKISTKGPFVVESFVIIGTFGCDYTFYINEILEFKIISMGRCKLGWFKSDKNLIPKVHILTLEWKKIPIMSGCHAVINQLIKSI
jgi:hypothetical protein